MSSTTLDQFLFIDSRVDNIESLLDGNLDVFPTK